MVKWDINIYASHIRTYQIEIVSDISYGFLKNGYPKPIGFPIKSYQCSANVEIPGTLWRALIEKWSFTILTGEFTSLSLLGWLYTYIYYELKLGSAQSQQKSRTSIWMARRHRFLCTKHGFNWNHLTSGRNMVHFCFTNSRLKRMIFHRSNYR